MGHLLSLLAWFIGGAICGMLHLMTLRWNVGLLAVGRLLAFALLVQLGRFAAIGAALAFVAVHQGAYALLASAGGVLAARTTALRWTVRN